MNQHCLQSFRLLEKGNGAWHKKIMCLVRMSDVFDGDGTSVVEAGSFFCRCFHSSLLLLISKESSGEQQ